MDAIILAGGKGTRLQSVVSDMPKPMADINGKPFLEYLLNTVTKYSVRRIVLSVGYKYEFIKDYFGKNYRGIDIIYAIENEPLGTGGALAESLKYIKDDNVFLLNGDTLFDVNLAALYDFHIKNSFDISMSLRKMTNFDRYGTVKFCNIQVVGFKEKSFRKTGYINGGVYVLKRTLLENLPQRRSFSFETDLLQRELNKIRVGAFVGNGYFIDIGIPEDYIKAQQELKYYS